MKIGAVVPAYESRADIRACLESILSSDLPAGWSLQVVVVDNSADDMVAEEAARFPVRLVRPGRNLGVAGGRNLGLTHLDGCGAVAFVDHDIRLSPGCLRSLVEALGGDATIGITTPRIDYADDPGSIWAMGTAINLRTARVRFITEAPSDKPFEVDVAPAVIVVSARALARVRGFDDRYFATFEDTDFCLRAREAAFRTFCVPTALAFHRTPLSPEDQRRHLLSRAYWVARNRTLFITRHGTRPLAYAAMLPGYLAYYGWLALRQRDLGSLDRYLRGTLAGFRGDAGWSLWLRHVPQTFLWRLRRQLPQTGLILDVGCGDGWLMSVLRFPSLRVVGVDIDPVKVSAASRRLVHNALVRVSIDRLPFRDATFDTVLCAEVMEHLPRATGLQALAEVERVARVRVLVTTPNGHGQEPEEAARDPHQEHRSEWIPQDFEERGYRVRGHGLRWARRRGGVARGRGALAWFAHMSLGVGPLIFMNPRRAAGLMAVRGPRSSPREQTGPSEPTARAARLPVSPER